VLPVEVLAGLPVQGAAVVLVELPELAAARGLAEPGERAVEREQPSPGVRLADRVPAGTLARARAARVAEQAQAEAQSVFPAQVGVPAFDALQAWVLV
jgi:hypothetical protein